MNLLKTPRLFLLLFLGYALLLMPRPSSGAAEPPSLTCNVTHQPDGSFFYQPSWLPHSPSCGTSWMHPNETVITRDSDFDPSLVQNLTREGVYLGLCLDRLKYIEECDGNPEEMICEVNCSSLLILTPSPPMVNSTRLIVWLCVAVLSAAVVFGAAGFGAAVCWIFKKHSKQVSYSPADNEVYVREVVQLDDIVIV